MSDLKAYIRKRKKADFEFRDGFDEGYKAFKIGVLLREAREASGLTQEKMAEKLHTRKSAISRIENHGGRHSLVHFGKICIRTGTQS